MLCQRSDWTTARLTMTHALVERLVGHRTRLAQESPERWHVAEDQELAAYVAASHRLDRRRVARRVPPPWLAPRGAAGSWAGPGRGPCHPSVAIWGDVTGL